MFIICNLLSQSSSQAMAVLFCALRALFIIYFLMRIERRNYFISFFYLKIIRKLFISQYIFILRFVFGSKLKEIFYITLNVRQILIPIFDKPIDRNTKKVK